ncbi:hypothetical protein [Paenibacillus beijingensis]|uniref:Uncharacterized protein n=1 Tax=Paenibacillus beijingensis TaxID=1126833 RepID=A0A0D5NM65_9BACL|nr:hypothetical protein [Paenibacillus beijingensis]AJY76419.1 hypothetical protein VN24_19910 [Paenibacillus beijingensis]
MYSNQPGNFQQGLGQFSQGQQQQYQPAGYVQSRYQGQLSQPTFNRSPQSNLPITSGLTNQFQNQPSQYTPAGGGFVQAQTQPNPVNSRFRTNQGPVISQLGYQAGAQNQNQFTQTQFQQQPIQSQFGTAMNTNAFSGQSYQPVISRVGYQAGQETRNPVIQATTYNQQQPQFGGYQAGSQMGSQMMQSQATSQFHPVHQITNTRQDAGPVISKLGYTNASGQNTF